jgi:S1-C subfamily serine protease
VRKLLVERNRRWYGLDLVLVSGAMAEALKVPQEGGFLVKQVVKDSVAGRLGLRGGDRMGIVDGQQIVVGGDILLSAQGMRLASNADMVQVLRMLETIKPGEVLKVTVLRDEKPVELSMQWTGW